MRVARIAALGAWVTFVCNFAFVNWAIEAKTFLAGDAWLAFALCAVQVLAGLVALIAAIVQKPRAALAASSGVLGGLVGVLYFFELRYLVFLVWASNFPAG